MGNNRRAGLIFIKVNGLQYDAKGEFTHNLGAVKREGVVGADGVHGYKETPQVPYIEGKITDKRTLVLSDLLGMVDATVTLEEANGKTVVLQEAWYAGDGNVTSGEAEVDFRFEGMRGEEIPA